MKMFYTLLVGAALTLGIVSTSSATGIDSAGINPCNGSGTPESAAVSSAQWTRFGKNLVAALKSDHSGLKQAALRLVIRYGPKVDVRDGVFDVMKIYRDGKDENLRRMAVVALGRMQSKWAIRFLDRSEQFESSPMLRQTIRAVVSENTDA